MGVIGVFAQEVLHIHGLGWGCGFTAGLVDDCACGGIVPDADG